MGIISEIIPCSLSVLSYLAEKLLRAFKLPLRPYKAVELYSGLTVIEITGIIQQMAFHIDLVFIADGGTHTHIGNRYVAAAVADIYLRGINTVAWDDNAVGKAHVDGGSAHLGTKMIAGAHRVTESMWVAQIKSCPLHVSFAYKAPDIGGADDYILPGDGGDYINADAPLGAVVLKLFGRALTLEAKGEVMAHNYPADIQLLNNALGKILPWHAHGAFAEMDEHHILYAVYPVDYLLASGGTVYKGDSDAENKIIRVYIEAEYRGLSPDFGGTLLGLVQKSAMAYVYAVKKTQRDGSFYL